MPTIAQVLGPHVDQLGNLAAGERPLDGIEAAIRRKRATRQGVTAAASVVGIGVLFAGGVAGTSYWDSIQPPWYYLPDGGGTVEIAVDGPDPTIPDLGIACGGPAPVAAPAADGFVAEVAVNSESPSYLESGYLDGTVKVTSNNMEEFPGFVLSPIAVVVRDGVVVGIENNFGLTHRLPFTPGRKSTPQEFGLNGWTECSDPDGTYLRAGEYEFYVVTIVANSPEIAAMSRVSDVYGGGPYFNGDKWLEPTDWECSSDQSDSAFGGWNGNAPACLPRLRPDFTWNPEARTVGLPYGDGQVTRVFSTQLVSGPFPYTAKGDYWAQQYQQAAGLPSVGDPTAPCGSELMWDEYGSEVYLAAKGMTSSRLDESGQLDVEVWAPFGPGGVESRTATIGAPEPGRALLTRWDSVTRDDGEWTMEVVAGTATVTVNGGKDIQLSRATGPVSVTVEFDDISWCDGLTPGEPLSAYVAAPLTVVADAKQHPSNWFTISNWG